MVFVAAFLLIQFLVQQPIDGQSSNWKTRQSNYVNMGGLGQQLQNRMLRNSDELIQYYAINMEDMDNFNFHLRKILIPRVPGTKGSKTVREHIANSMQNLGWDVQIDSFTEPNTVLGKAVNFKNVIATLDKNAPRRLLIACHYDSKISPKGFLGATDSAVPCAQMINLATVMKNDLNAQKNKDSEVTLQFVFFDGEEAFKNWNARDSIYGSRNLAALWEKQRGYRYKGFPTEGDNTLGRIDIFMLLDLLGTNDPEPTVVSSQQSTHNWYKRLRANEKMLMDNRPRFQQSGLLRGTGNKRIFVTSGDRSRRTGVEDDHKPFEKRGVPILHVIATPFPKQWHKSGDNLNTVHFPTVEKLNKIFRLFVAEYLQLPTQL